jgi:3-oxoacyl-[acyl-carrier protein] reductase
MINLKSRIAVITGGSRGIGAACVKLFAEAGANVAFTYQINNKAAEKIVSDCSAKSKVKAYKCDLSDPEEIEATVKNIYSDFGRIDFLVNNAGVWKYGPADKMSLKDWEETIRINLTGTFLFTKAVIPTMKENKFGRIINIASTAGQRGEANYSHYASSKGGVISFTKSMATELGPFNITTNAVAPGWVFTDMTSDELSDKKYRNEIEEDIPLKRLATSEDIAGPVLFLASDLARHINGEILNVNGGSILCG